MKKGSNERTESHSERVVNSGRGTHLYFALNKPIDPEKAQELNESLARATGDAGADTVRIHFASGSGTINTYRKNMYR